MFVTFPGVTIAQICNGNELVGHPRKLPNTESEQTGAVWWRDEADVEAISPSCPGKTWRRGSLEQTVLVLLHNNKHKLGCQDPRSLS